MTIFRSLTQARGDTRGRGEEGEAQLDARGALQAAAPREEGGGGEEGGERAVALGLLLPLPPLPCACIR